MYRRNRLLVVLPTLLLLLGVRLTLAGVREAQRVPERQATVAWTKQTYNNDVSINGTVASINGTTLVVDHPQRGLVTLRLAPTTKVYTNNAPIAKPLADYGNTMPIHVSDWVFALTPDPADGARTATTIQINPALAP